MHSKENDQEVSQDRTPLTRRILSFLCGVTRKWIIWNVLLAVLSSVCLARSWIGSRLSHEPYQETVCDGRYKIDLSHTMTGLLCGNPFTRAIKTYMDGMGRDTIFEVKITPEELIVGVDGLSDRFPLGRKVVYKGKHPFGPHIFLFSEIGCPLWGLLPTVMLRETETEIAFDRYQVDVMETTTEAGTFLFLISGITKSSRRVMRLIRVGDIERSEDIDGGVSE